jgi:hypothetical protein
MKKSVIFLAVLLITLPLIAQPRKYRKSMENALALMDNATSPAQHLECAAQFESVAESYETMWMPPYYSALSLIIASFEENEYGRKMEYLDQANGRLERARQLNSQESEIEALAAFYALAMMAADPESNGPMYLEDFNIYLNKAKALNPENPRPYYMDALLKENLPEFMGGGPDQAKSLYLTADEKFKSFQNNDPFWPHWGETLNREQMDRLGI